MKKILISFISIILVLSILLASAIAVSAASGIQEVYLSELRLVYADSYNEAKLVLSESLFSDYKLLDRNLNSNTGETGVWLAYKTNTDISEAITDLAVMQMGGGYNAGNYQQLIQNSRYEFLDMGDMYMQAIQYFIEAYDAGDFLAETAYRQLNFYCGIDDFETDPLGDLFVEDVLSSYDLATLFLQGNAQVLDNIRALLAMGVSYNDDGMHYLEKVEASAAKMNAKPTVFDKKGYNDLAEIIAPTVATFRTVFEELSAYEDELDYEDGEFTDLEIKYSEYMALAEMLRGVNYLGGKTLYEFCLDYSIDTKNYSALYPLVDALNEGQEAMATLSRYYDVVRYSMSETPNELIESELAKLEETYGTASVSVYLGVDREIYDGTFALTNRAYRTNAYDNDSTLLGALFGDTSWMMSGAGASSGAIGVGISVFNIATAGKKLSTMEAVREAIKASQNYAKMVAQALNAIAGESVSVLELIDAFGPGRSVFQVVCDTIYDYDKQLLDPKATLSEMYDCFIHLMLTERLSATKEAHAAWLLANKAVSDADKAAVASPSLLSKIANSFGSALKTGLYFSGTVVLVINAISLYKKIYEHYNPNYDDVPTAMVDLIDTEEGESYVKYNVVYEVKRQSDGGYAPADLNAYEGERWNALYYTKNSDAGKPLLAEFEFSDNNNRAPEGYAPVHRFGEVICYDLNKYVFSSDSDSIFMSVEQAKNERTEDVPTVVGSLFSDGLWVIVGVAGAIVGGAATLGVQAIIKRGKRRKVNVSE